MAGRWAEGVDGEVKVRFGKDTRQMEQSLRRLAAQRQESVWRLECMDGHE
jgi:hypothetical protein